MAFHGFGAREMDGFVPAKVKRKDLEEVYDEFSEFSLSSPPRKIRRLEAELPPIMEEDELLAGPASEDLPLDSPSSSSTPPNEERALVLYKPVSALPLGFDSPPPSNVLFKIDPNLIASLENQSLVLDQKASKILKERASINSLALVPWIPPPQLPEDDAMESEDVGSTAMDVELGSDELNQWHHPLQQQRHHCMGSQINPSESTHVMW